MARGPEPGRTGTGHGSGRWKTVRVFISSTFRDMHAERDLLVRDAFPALRERLAPDCIHLVDVDLRWGVTRQQAENDLALDVCLRQIDECRPFFVGILGQRYGWVPRQFPLRALGSYGWIQQHTGKSITELEMLYGVLNDPRMRDRALFFLRDDSYISDLPPEQREIYVESATREEIERLEPAMAEAEAARRAEALRELKNRILELVPGPFVFNGYPCRWDPAARNRYSELPGRLTGLESFGDCVLARLEAAIRAAPELRTHFAAQLVPPPDPDGRLEEADHHERFIESRLYCYVDRKEVFEELLRFTSGDEALPAVVLGPSGSGKSALLARLARELQDHPDFRVIPHFVGASPASTGLRGMLKRFCLELGPTPGDGAALPQEPRALARRFDELLRAAPAGHRIAIVIDGLNQLDESDGAHSLFWLPQALPAHVRIVVSANSDPDAGRVIQEALAERAVHRISVGRLTTQEQRDILEQVPSLAAKTLDGDQVSLFLSNPNTRNPLFLLVALEELRGFGSFEHLDLRIRELPPGGDPTTEIFLQVIERLMVEFDGETARRILVFLACARHGLSERELRRLVDGEVEGSSRGDFFLILRQIRPYLMWRGEFLDFAHRGLYKAVRRRFLPGFLEERTVRLELADYFQPSADQARGIEEWPWQLMRGGYWRLLAEALGNFRAVATLLAGDRYALCEYWARLRANSTYRPENVYREVVDSPERFDVALVTLVARVLETTGALRQSLRLWESVRDRELTPGDASTQLGVMDQLANLRLVLGDLAGARRDVEAAITLARSTGDTSALASGLGSLGRILDREGDVDGAWKSHEEAAKIYRQLQNPGGLQAALGNQAAILQSQGKWREALELHRQAEELCRENGEWDGLQRSLANRAVILMDRRNLQQAGELFEEALRICRQYGNLHGQERALGNLARLHRDTGDLSRAKQLNEEQERICRMLGEPLELCLCLEIKAGLLTAASDPARETLLEVLGIQREREQWALRCSDSRQVEEARVGQATVHFLLGNEAEAIRIFEGMAEHGTSTEEPDGRNQ